VDEGARNNWQPLFEELVKDRRATTLYPVDALTNGDRLPLWVAAERLVQLRAIHPEATLTPKINPPAPYANEPSIFEDALVEIMRGRLEALGPVTVPQLASSISLETNRVNAALARLESEGFAMQGNFTPGESTSANINEPNAVAPALP